jgi:mono/diheme cytochrome c family protein
MARTLIGGLILAALAVSALPAAAAPVPAPADPDQPPMAVAHGKFTMKDGEQIYKQVCSGCHMPDAKGAQGAGIYPSLAGNPKLAVAAYPIHVIVKGQKGMPVFGPLLDDDQVAAVTGYIRTHFGNSYAKPVTAAEVLAQR